MVCLLPRTAYVAKYLGLCVLLSGSYIASPLTVAWLSGNIEGANPIGMPRNFPLLTPLQNPASVPSSLA